MAAGPRLRPRGGSGTPLTKVPASWGQPPGWHRRVVTPRGVPQVSPGALRGGDPPWGCPQSVPTLSPRPQVLFTGVVASSAMEVALRTLGGAMATSVFDCTHLVTDSVRRTVKFLCAVARGIPIVTPEWLYKVPQGGWGTGDGDLGDREEDLGDMGGLRDRTGGFLGTRRGALGTMGALEDEGQRPWGQGWGLWGQGTPWGQRRGVLGHVGNLGDRSCPWGQRCCGGQRRAVSGDMVALGDRGWHSWGQGGLWVTREGSFRAGRSLGVSPRVPHVPRAPRAAVSWRRVPSWCVTTTKNVTLASAWPRPCSVPAATPCSR